MAHRILTAALDRLPHREATVTATEISNAMMVQTRRQHKRLLSHLGDLVRSGRLARVKNGVYRRTDSMDTGKPEIRVLMWRLLRMRRAVSIGDLMEMAGASERYAHEWLRMLEKTKIVRHDGGIWRLLVDTVEMPENDDAAEKYRRLRAKKKGQAMADLQQAKEMIAAAIELLKDV